jgi:hypothetical protein
MCIFNNEIIKNKYTHVAYIKDEIVVEVDCNVSPTLLRKEKGSRKF